jgi:predicted nuclease of predicted toxin-antitoxin system
VRFLANENVERGLVESLRRSGHDVKYMAEIKPRIEDQTILQQANLEGRILITNDKDFGELAFLQCKVVTGILLLRFRSEDTNQKIAVLQSALSRYGSKMQGNFTVISETKIRIRKIEVR